MLACSMIYSQDLNNSGLPMLTYFPYSEYNADPQNWDIVQAPSGKMYFANGDGVLEFDGNWWRLIELPNRTLVRSLDVAGDGTIYVGGYEEFGYLKENKSGFLEYKSLLHLLPDDHEYFQDVWTTNVVGNEIFFQTSRSIFKLKDSTIEELKSEQAFVWGSVSHDHFFAHDFRHGLKIYSDGDLKKLTGTDRFRSERIYNVLDYNDSLHLLTTEKGNLFICNIDTTELQLTIKDSVNNSLTELIKENWYYTGINYNNEKFCFSTFYGGLFLSDMSFNPIMNLNESFGLDNNNITDIYEDQNNNIWITMDRGITLVNMDLSITIFNKFSNLTGSINDAIVYDNPADNIPKRLYVASIEGIFYKDLDVKTDPLDEEKFQKFSIYENFRNESWSFFEHNNSLLCASSAGTFELTNDSLYTISWRSAKSFTPVKNKPETLIVNLVNGLEVIKHEQERWTAQNRIAGSQGYISSSVFDNAGYLWKESVNEGVIKLQLSKDIDSVVSRKSYSTDQGLPSPALNYPYWINNELKVTTEKGIYQYNKSEDRFVPDEQLNQLIGDVSPDFLLQTPKKNIWYISSRTKALGELIHQPDGEYLKDTSHFYDIRNFAVQNINYHDDSTIFLCSYNGLILYNKNKRKEKNETLRTHINKVEITNNSTDVYTVPNRAPTEKPLTLNFDQNAIRFYFAATSFVSAYENQFSYFLEGFDKNEQWSDWTNQAIKEYNFLREGEYTLHVKSRDMHMNIGNTVSYHFEIRPPFYRSNIARIFYVVLITLIIYLLLVLNSRRLRSANVKLEKKVKERTREVRAQKKKVTDSIEYALHIQKAILPSEDTIKEISEEFFIYYNPKDIVSGDFYWYNKCDDAYFFATVDYTGHGVPGAFMSMIGNTLLNEIVIHEKILQPAKILETLNSRLKFILNQGDEDNDANTDGMDLSLIKIDKKNRVLTIASAIHSVILIQNDELKLIQGDLCDIGGIFSNREEFKITERRINYKKGCLVYMFSDGFTDQFGGNSDQKFKLSRLKKLLFEIRDLPMHIQRKNIEYTFNEWKGDNRQIDDVTVIGFKL